ncbi:scavenger receptor cysteine-rich type 1 M130-like protein [Labeo rohita]|uniref:Scavenger receptor cysteine-rich type 1 M130-like protein n=1 Tax=Labeo rohita TaxID=84645 RepID=A0A498LVS3_LABRO|nr:scavenger receptor cysteine-rich type 1 M130-like protein [Labeo rohita]
MRHMTTTEAVYEEIQHRHNHFTQRERMNEITPENYDDVIDGLKPDHETVDTPEHYDDVIINGQDSRGVTGSSLALHDGLVRLSGERECEGEVEVFIHQVWRRVLLDSWSLTESSVVCRQLGCGSVLNFYGSSSYSPEHSHECVTGFQCSGSEAHLGNCSSPQTLNCSSTQQLSITCLEFKEIRLTEGCEGNVEVFYNGSWGNVCWNQMDRDTCPSSPWGQNDCGEDEVAKIICSDLLVVSTTPGTTTSNSPSGSPPVHSTSVTLSQTPPAVSYQSSVPPVLVIVLVVVLLLLLVPLLILIQQNRVMRRALSKRRHRTTTEAGYEEIQHKPTNRHSLFTQRDDSPRNYDGVVIVKQLSNDKTDGVQEENDDVKNEREYTSDMFDSSLALHDGLVRLSGERQCEGEVEVFIHQVWRRVLLDSWSLTDSSVVCRQLGCGSVLNFYGSSSSSPEHSHECVTGFQCSGSEAHLGNCSSPQTLNCSSTQQLSITCLEFKEIRLTEGCEGNVEVFYNGSWGNLCYNKMDRDTASLICQELNCGISGSEPKNSVGLKPHNWLDFLKCRRHDSTLWQCPSSPWGQNDCNNEVAKITCSDLSVSTNPATATSASPPVSPPVRSTSVSPPQTPPAASLSAPPVLVIVLVVVLLLLLVPLLILIQQNRVMRRALSKRRHRTMTETVYEEIQHRHNHFTQREMVNEITPEYYDDVITDGLKPDHETVDTPEHYDDVIINRQESQGVTEADQEEYDDVKNSSDDERNLLDSSLALHDGLVRLSGERQCEGEVEVFIHQVWRRVLLDSWSLTESSVVCRQLGCGSVLNFYGSSSSSPEHSHECVTGFQCSGSEAHLGNCSSPQTLNCSSTQQLSITCLDFCFCFVFVYFVYHLEFKEIRLTEGCEGNVEVFYNGSWGNVCLNQMDRDTVSLICQELNCGRSGVLSGSTPRVESAPNWLGEVTCRPHDSNLWQCPSSPWGQNDCGKEEVAKIICSEQGSDESPRSYLICSTSPHHRQCSDFPDLSVSTAPATTTSASPPVSSPVLSTSVTLSQTTPAVSPQFFVPPELVIVLVVVLLLLLVPLLILIQQNRVMRRALSKRRHRTTTEAVYEEIQHRPTNRQSLFTQRGSLLSTEQHSGYEDADKPLSDDLPENYDDVVIVQQFSNDKTDTFISEGVQEEYDDVNVSENICDMFDWFGEGSGEIRADVFDCDGNETKLSECSISSWSRAECSHRRDVGVICSDSSLALHDGLVRLSGERQCEGEVEVFIHQVWRRVLLDSWSLTESSVVCRQLGCGSVLNFYGSSSSSPEHSHECVTGFQCSGSEAHLGNCSSPQTLNCSSTQQLSITCLEFKEIRLTEGCEGNVEVFYNGSWGNLCYNKMDRDTASLICQELNCGRSGSEPENSVGLKPHNWLDFLKCRRHDSTLWQCPSSPWGQNDCNHEVAKIACSGKILNYLN